MLKPMIIGGLAIVAGAGIALAQGTMPPAAATAKMTQAQCDAVWMKADSTKIGSVSSAQAQTFVTDFKAADTNNDGKLTKAEFTAACTKGLVHEASASTGSSTAPSTTSAPK